MNQDSFFGGSAGLYEALAAEFDETFTDNRGGVQLTYITGEQAISRLNEVLGVGGWSFRILEHGYRQDADEIWVKGEIAADIEGVTVIRQQFGSQKLKRSRNDQSNILDIGFDLKGAATDALKKCASLLGVGLYLSHKEPPPERASAAEPVRLTRDTAVASTNGAASEPASGVLVCEVCGEDLKPIQFKDNTTWSPALLASYGRRKHGRVLCMPHYREANERVKGPATPPPATLPVASPAYEPEETF